MLTRRIFKNCLVALMCLTFVAAGCGDDNDGNNGGGGELSDAGNNSAQDGSSNNNNNNPDEDGGTSNEDGGGEEDADAYNPCDDGMSYCDGECVDVNGSSEDHCGACGASCKLFAACVQGTCICENENATYCDGYCISTETDEVNCGECGNVCGGDNVCFDSDCMSLGERIAHEINQYRSSEVTCSGSTIGPNAPLRFDPLLTAPAQEHAEDMAANDGEAQGDLNERIAQSSFEGEVLWGTQATGFKPDDLLSNDNGNGILDGNCGDVLNPDATAIGVGVAGEVDDRNWVVLVANDG